MIIATNINTNDVVGYGEKLTYWSNGYPALESESTVMAFTAGAVNIHEVPDDSEFEVYKTCYTPELGFYPNPNWREPSPFDDEQYAAGYEQALLDLLEEE